MSSQLSAMPSLVEADDGIDRTKTPAHEIPIRRQKQNFTTDVISNPWVEGQREIISKLKDGTRVVSPRTLMFIDDILNQCDAALSQETKDEYYEELIEGLQTAVPFLEARLETDEQYANELKAFQALGHDNILLKYGDYAAEGCNTIRSLAAGSDKKLLQGRFWTDVVKDLEDEEQALAKWTVGLKPKTPVKDLIRKISLLWKDFNEKQMVDMMKFNSDRNLRAHNGLNEFIKGRKWARLATLLRQDYHAVTTYYPHPKDAETVELLQKIVISCQNKFFVWIKDDWYGPNVSAENWKLLDHIAKEDDKIEAKEQKAKLDAENAAILQNWVLQKSKNAPISDAKMAELVDAQTDYQKLLNDEKEIAKKRKTEESERKKAAKAKIAEAKARLDKALEEDST